jgi:YgiT-type zinc finger domain-containing protein
MTTTPPDALAGIVHDVQRDSCPCGGRYEPKLVEVTVTVDDEQRVMTDVSQRACPECGSRVYSPATLERIESVIRSGSPAAT